LREQPRRTAADNRDISDVVRDHGLEE
jgi:hypothetical protein